MFKVLASRIVVFALACLWVFGLILVGIATYPAFQATLVSVIGPTWLITASLVWYVATLVLVGVWVAVKGFRFVGKWEKENKSDEN